MHAQCIESFAGGLAMPAARFVKYFRPVPSVTARLYWGTTLRASDTAIGDWLGRAATKSAMRGTHLERMPGE